MRTILVLVVAAGLALGGFVLAETQRRGPAEHAPRAPEEQSLSQELAQQELRDLNRLEKRQEMRQLQRLEERAEAHMQRYALQAQVRTGDCDEPGDVTAEMVKQQRGPQARWAN